MVELEKVLLVSAKRLDIEMFEEFKIHTEECKQSKRLFLLKDMTISFNKFKHWGYTRLEPNLGVCNKGRYGYMLFGNKSKNYMNLLFENDVDKIIGIAECPNLKTADEIWVKKKEFIFTNTMTQEYQIMFPYKILK
jgi:hypothetical protein